MEDGEECAFIPGILVLLKQCADGWDFHHQVRTRHVKNVKLFKKVKLGKKDAGLGTCLKAVYWKTGCLQPAGDNKERVTYPHVKCRVSSKCPLSALKPVIITM